MGHGGQPDVRYFLATSFTLALVTAVALAGAAGRVRVGTLFEQQAHDIDPNASALLADAAGHVTETAAANFLIVKDGSVLTPPRQTVLNGVSLLVVEELCCELGIPFAERRLTIAECQSADEAMLTCTSYCVAGVRKLNGVELPWPGPVWRRLLAAWSKRVGVDIEAQIVS